VPPTAFTVTHYFDTAGELAGAYGRARAFWMRRVSAALLEASHVPSRDPVR
jgi:hypothetical protein